MAGRGPRVGGMAAAQRAWMGWRRFSGNHGCVGLCLPGATGLDGMASFFCPEGAGTNQPRAERSGDSRRAPPWGRCCFRSLALKGRNNAQLADRPVVPRRWLVTGFGANGNWLGDVVAVSGSDFRVRGDGEALCRRGLAIGLSFWEMVRSVFHPWLWNDAMEFPGFACIGSAWRPAWFGLMRIFPPFPPHRACRKFFVLRSSFFVRGS